MKLVLEITKEMQEKLQERANKYMVEPAGIAKWILANELAISGKPCWMDKLHDIVTRLTNAVIAVSKTEAPKEEK